MRAGSLKTVLIDYRPSLLVRVMIQGRHLHDTTVAAMLGDLMGKPDDAVVTLFGSTELIFKERQHGFDAARYLAQQELPLGPGPLAREWLEIDVR